MTEGLRALYRYRFSNGERRRRHEIWKVLCEDYFQRFVCPNDIVLDVPCGLGEFIRHIRCGVKIAVDLNRDVEAELGPDVRFLCAHAEAMPEIDTGSVDVCFVSNFFEHLASKAAMDAVLRELRRVLRRGGRLINLQPNIRYEPGRYWDFYDHVLPLSDRSAAEAFVKNGYLIERVIPRFLPFTTKSALPQHPAVVRAYLRFPPAWRLLGGQFLIVARTT